MSKPDVKKVSMLNRFLNLVEAGGNKCPHPITLFALMCLLVVVLSAIFAALGLSATGELINSAEGTMETQTIEAVSLLTGPGIIHMLTTAVGNFTSYAPLGVVLVAMLGVGVAESSGFISAVLKQTVLITPKFLITPMVVFLGVMSNIAADAGYVVLIPIGALMFMAYHRHPLAGLAAAFAGVSGGFSANLLIGTLDPMLAGISNEAVRLIDPTYVVEPTGNWYFLIVSTFLITILGTLVTDKIVEPRLGSFSGNHDTNELAAHAITPQEKKALKSAGLTAVILVISLVAWSLPQNSILRNPDTGSIVGASPFMNSIIVLIALFFFIPGAVYGFVSKKYQSEKDVCEDLGKSMATLGGFLALAFVAAQFVNYFNYTQLGTILAIKGASLFEQSGIGLIPLMLLFILFSAVINLFMGSASAKWAIMAPVFVPIFMLLGYSPELAQLAFRIGDSCTNLITPLMTYFAMIVVFVKKYDPKAGIGTITAMMLPYSLVFLVGWSLLLIVWILLDLPLGPGVGLYL